MQFISCVLLSIFFPGGASPQCIVPGCAGAPRQVSLLQVHEDRTVAASVELSEASSARDLAQEHVDAGARTQKAHATAWRKLRALRDVEQSLKLTQRSALEGDPDASVDYHTNASADYKQQINKTDKCKACALAEQNLIAALEAAQKSHFDAQRKAEEWANSKDAYEAASEGFRTTLDTHAATQKAMQGMTLTYQSSNDEYNNLKKLVQKLHTQAQAAVEAETEKGNLKTAADTAVSLYKAAAAAALAADEIVVAKRAQEEDDCAEYGELAATPSPEQASLVTDGFEYMDRKCSTSAGRLQKISNGPHNHGAWDCVGFDTRVDVSNKGPGPRGISFKCGRRGHSNVGLQWAGPNARASEPSTWDTSSTGNFKKLVDAFNSDTCQTNKCAETWAYNNGFDAGFSCRGGGLYRSYANRETGGGHIGRYNENTVLSLVVDGDEFKWYVDGQLKATAAGIQGKRAGRSMAGPFWPIGTHHDPGDWLFDLKYISAPGVEWSA